jgi:hypothetical protein
MSILIFQLIYVVGIPNTTFGEGAQKPFRTKNLIIGWIPIVINHHSQAHYSEWQQPEPIPAQQLLLGPDIMSIENLPLYVMDEKKQSRWGPG